MSTCASATGSVQLVLNSRRPSCPRLMLTAQNTGLGCAAPPAQLVLLPIILSLPTTVCMLFVSAGVPGVSTGKPSGIVTFQSTPTLVALAGYSGIHCAVTLNGAELLNVFP